MAFPHLLLLNSFCFSTKRIQVLFEFNTSIMYTNIYTHTYIRVERPLGNSKRSLEPYIFRDTI